MTAPPKIRIRPNPLPKFKILYDLPPGTWLVINIGGRGGGKSYEVSKWGIIQAIVKQKRLALLRDEHSSISQSIMHEFKMRYAELNEKSNNYFDAKWNMHDNGLKNTETGMMHIFSKGFRTSKVSQKAGLKSISDVDIAIVEEFEDIEDEDKFNTFADTIRKDNAVIVINSNVPSKNHWFVKRYFNLLKSEHDGFYQLEPKTIPGVVYIYSTFADNPHLAENTISRYHAYGDPDSNLYNLEHYLTDILGYVSEGAKGRIYKDWGTITSEEFERLPYAPFYGLDFGYSADPVAVVKIKVHNDHVWCKELIYEPGLTNPKLAEKLKVRGVDSRAIIYADSAEPKSIDELSGYGFNVVRAIKGPDSLLAGIKFLQAKKVFVTEDSNNLWHENQEYKWELDQNKNPTDTPMDKNNHLKDAIRYGVYTKYYRPETPGYRRAN